MHTQVRCPFPGCRRTDRFPSRIKAHLESSAAHAAERPHRCPCAECVALPAFDSYATLVSHLINEHVVVHKYAVSSRNQPQELDHSTNINDLLPGNPLLGTTMHLDAGHGQPPPHPGRRDDDRYSDDNDDDNEEDDGDPDRDVGEADSDPSDDDHNHGGDPDHNDDHDDEDEYAYDVDHEHHVGSPGQDDTGNPNSGGQHDGVQHHAGVGNGSPAAAPAVEVPHETYGSIARLADADLDDRRMFNIESAWGFLRGTSASDAFLEWALETRQTQEAFQKLMLLHPAGADGTSILESDPTHVQSLAWARQRKEAGVANVLNEPLTCIASPSIRTLMKLWYSIPDTHRDIENMHANFMHLYETIIHADDQVNLEHLVEPPAHFSEPWHGSRWWEAVFLCRHTIQDTMHRLGLQMNHVRFLHISIFSDGFAPHRRRKYTPADTICAILMNTPTWIRNLRHHSVFLLSCQMDGLPSLEINIAALAEQFTQLLIHPVEAQRMDGSRTCLFPIYHGTITDLKARNEWCGVHSVVGARLPCTMCTMG